VSSEPRREGDPDGKAGDSSRLLSRSDRATLKTTLIVLAPPSLLAFHDDNGDGVSDRTETLVKGIGFDLKFRGADHTTNGIQVGIDGWLYVAVGDYGFIKATGSDGKELAYRGGGIVRVRPDGSELEVVSRGQRNIYDVAISPELDLFTRDNTNDGGGWNVRLSHVPHGGQMGYPSLFINFPDEIIQPLADYGGGSPCGSLFIDEPTLPEGLGHSLYTCDWGRSIVYRHPLTKTGAGFTAEQEPFVELPRPTDMDIDASGNIYISSWRDGGFNFSKPEVGYVVMVQPPRVAESLRDSDSAQGNKSNKEASSSNESSREANLLRGLSSASHTIRLNAQRDILAQGQSPELVAGLEQLAASSSSAAVRVAAIFTLKQLLGEKSHDTLVRLAKDASIREHALRALADRSTQLANTSPQPFVEALSDANARVRLQAARGLGRFGKLSREVLAKLLPLAVDRDPVVAHVAIDSLVRLNSSEVCLAALSSSPQEHRVGAAKVLRHLHDPAVVTGLIEWLNHPVTAKPVGPTGQAISAYLTRNLILTTLCRLHDREGEYTGDWWSTRPDTSGPYYKPVAWSETERITKALQSELAAGDPSVLKELFVQLSLHKIELPGVKERIVALAQSDKEFFPQAIGLLAGGNSTISDDAALLLEVAATLRDSQPERRATALRGLLRRTRQPDVLEIAVRTFGEIYVTESELNGDLAAVMDEFIRDPVLAKQVARLGMIIETPSASAERVPLVREFFYAILVQVADNPRGEKADRDAALKIVERAWSQPELAVSLLRAIGRSNAESQSLQVVNLMKSENAAIRDAAKWAAAKLELDKEPPVDPKKPLLAKLSLPEAIAQTLPIKGDEKYGKKLFARQGCSACHTVSQNEPLKGPLLLDIAKRYKREDLIESIIKPSAKIAQGFESQFFVTEAGKVFDGFVVRESGEEVELRNVAGLATILKKSEIEERGKRDISIMPLGLTDKLNVEQLAAILAYLESLKGK